MNDGCGTEGGVRGVNVLLSIRPAAQAEIITFQPDVANYTQGQCFQSV